MTNVKITTREIQNTKSHDLSKYIDLLCSVMMQWILQYTHGMAWVKVCRLLFR